MLPGWKESRAQQLETQHSIRLKFPQEQDGGAFQPFVSEEWFRTPSGKAEFYSETLAAQGHDPLPGYVAADESRHSPLARKFPLELLPRKNDNFMNSTFAGLPSHRAMEAAHFGVLEMHPERRCGPRNCGWRRGGGVQRTRKNSLASESRDNCACRSGRFPFRMEQAHS